MSTHRWQTTVEPQSGDQGSAGADAERPVPGLILVASGGRPAFAPCPVGDKTVELGRAHGALSAFPDNMMSRQHACIAFQEGRFRITDLGSRNGSALNGQSFTGTLHAPEGSLLRLGHSLFLLYDDLRPLYEYGVRVDERRVEGPALQRMQRAISGIAQHSRTLSILGESGSGKEALAHAYHRFGPQQAGPFIVINCATLPEGVAERLLFGAQKGAYSGATAASEGYIQAASGGTLFLDEIGDLDLAVQAKLLRVIENGEVTALGATRPLKVDLRLCSATNADLRALVSAGKFRADLYFRLGVPQLRVPPLRERREEIPWLLNLAVRQLAPTLQIRVALIEQCLLRMWPGNVRELLAEVHSAALAAAALGSTAVGPEHLSSLAGLSINGPASVPAPPQSPQSPQRPQSPQSPQRPQSPQIEEPSRSLPEGDADSEEPGELPDPALPSRARLLAVLFECNGNLSAAARALSMHRTQLRRYLTRLGIDPSRLREMVGTG